MNKSVFLTGLVFSSFLAIALSDDEDHRRTVNMYESAIKDLLYRKELLRKAKASGLDSEVIYAKKNFAMNLDECRNYFSSKNKEDLTNELKLAMCERVRFTSGAECLGVLLYAAYLHPEAFDDVKTAFFEYHSSSDWKDPNASGRHKQIQENIAKLSAEYFEKLKTEKVFIPDFSVNHREWRRMTILEYIEFQEAQFQREESESKDASSLNGDADR